MEEFNITFDLKYESDDEEREERARRELSQDQVTSRSVILSPKDLDSMEKSSHEGNTVKQTSWAVNCFESWLKERNYNNDLNTTTKTELAALLREFYGSIRTVKGDMYGISSYAGLRAGLNRHLNEPPLSRTWNLMLDTEFTAASNVFKGVLKQIRRAGKDTTTHHPPISNEDLVTLKTSAALQPNNPKSLLQKVWFDIQLHFGRRGCEGKRQLKPDSFVLVRDENSCQYYTMAFNEETKNHKNPLERTRENNRGAMYEEPGNPLCPVASLSKYLRKIPADAKALYLHPRRSASPSDSLWFTTVPVGVNQLSQLLPRLCSEAGTKVRYTNHSLRATAIQKLSDAGLSAREIMTVSGHRSESSLASYWRPTLENRKRWSHVLGDHHHTAKTLKYADQQISNRPTSDCEQPGPYLSGCTIQGNVQINVYK